MTAALLEVEHLSVGYRTATGMQLAVDDVSFQVERGGSLGLVGESGCGKTTIGMALMGLANSRPTDCGFSGCDGSAKMLFETWLQIVLKVAIPPHQLREAHLEDHSPGFTRKGLDLSLVDIQDTLDDGQSQAGTAWAGSVFHPVELLEDMR